MSSAAAQFPDALPEPPVFKPKNNPAFILHGKLKTSFEEVSDDVRR
jgi:D-xylulose reductase